VGRETGRLLPFEPDMGKRYHFRKYVEGILWRGVSVTERDKRILDTISRNRVTPTTPPASTRTTESLTTGPRILAFCRPLIGNDRLLVEHVMEMERERQEERQLEVRPTEGDANPLEPLDSRRAEPAN
jgi:hypothetical protein